MVSSVCSTSPCTRHTALVAFGEVASGRALSPTCRKQASLRSRSTSGGTDTLHLALDCDLARFRALAYEQGEHGAAEQALQESGTFDRLSFLYPITSQKITDTRGDPIVPSSATRSVRATLTRGLQCSVIPAPGRRDVELEYGWSDSHPYLLFPHSKCGVVNFEPLKPYEIYRSPRAYFSPNAAISNLQPLLSRVAEVESDLRAALRTLSFFILSSGNDTKERSLKPAAYLTRYQMQHAHLQVALRTAIHVLRKANGRAQAAKFVSTARRPQPRPKDRGEGPPSGCCQAKKLAQRDLDHL
ncbi:hypothetical protein AURDEDRAFT_126722 [Auricularia subglabra TFB-10046 SS5]|nr:hypothetical protein AURDEDRAFT_126722 [Auricularia subglabra TFB-10046 SS5]